MHFSVSWWPRPCSDEDSSTMARYMVMAEGNRETRERAARWQARLRRTAGQVAAVHDLLRLRGLRKQLLDLRFVERRELHRPVHWLDFRQLLSPPGLNRCSNGGECNQTEQHRGDWAPALGRWQV